MEKSTESLDYRCWIKMGHQSFSSKRDWLCMSAIASLPTTLIPNISLTDSLRALRMRRVGIRFESLTETNDIRGWVRNQTVPPCYRYHQSFDCLFVTLAKRWGEVFFLFRFYNALKKRGGGGSDDNFALSWQIGVWGSFILLILKRWRRDAAWRTLYL